MRHPIATLLVLASGFGLVGCARPPSAVLAAAAPAEVQVSHPIEREVTDYADFTGRLDAVGSVEIRARVSGQLDKVHFQDGDEVKEGDLLFEIDPRPYAYALERAAGNAEQAQARLERLDAEQRRISQLFARGSSNREELDQISGELKEARALLNVAKSDRDLAALNVDFTRIRAPFSGRLGRRLVDPGNLVQANETPLATIVAVDHLNVYFDVDEGRVLMIRSLIREGKARNRTGPEKQTILVGLANESGYPHEGMVDFSDNRINPRTGTLTVRGVIENPMIEGANLRMFSPGLFARVRLPYGFPRRALLVSERAFVSDQGQKILYVLDSKDRVTARSVRLGALHDGLREVVAGLSPSDRVVVVGTQQVREGAVVTPKVIEMPTPGVEESGASRGASGDEPAQAG